MRPELERLQEDAKSWSERQGQQQADVKASVEERDGLRQEVTKLSANAAALEAELDGGQDVRQRGGGAHRLYRGCAQGSPSGARFRKAARGDFGTGEARSLDEVKGLNAALASKEAEGAGLAKLSERAQGELDSAERALQEARQSLAAAQAAEGSARAREVELTTRLTEREAKLDVVQRRLAAQEAAALNALRRAAGRTGPPQVKEILTSAPARSSPLPRRRFAALPTPSSPLPRQSPPAAPPTPSSSPRPPHPRPPARQRRPAPPSRPRGRRNRT